MERGDLKDDVNLEMEFEESAVAVPPRKLNPVAAYLQKWRGEEGTVTLGGTPWLRLNTQENLVTAFVGSFVAIGLLGAPFALVGFSLVTSLTGWLDQHVLSQPGSLRLRGVIGSMGAAAVLLYAAPSSELAQPRNVLVGNLVACLVGIGFQYFAGVNQDLRWLAGALAVACSIVCMMLTKTVHPPAGATSFILATASDPLLLDSPFKNLFFPVMAGFGIMVAIAVVLNNVLLRYPKYWV